MSEARRYSINVASMSAFFDTVRTLTLAGFVWDESGYTWISPPNIFMCDFIEQQQPTQGEQQ